MMGHVRSMGLRGLDGYEISVECYITNGLPGFDVVGLPDTAVKEAREHGDLSENFEYYAAKRDKNKNESRKISILAVGNFPVFVVLLCIIKI